MTVSIAFILFSILFAGLSTHSVVSLWLEGMPFSASLMIVLCAAGGGLLQATWSSLDEWGMLA